eukprot:6208414-Pleurochrysis_carterae.AAC.7
MTSAAAFSCPGAAGVHPAATYYTSRLLICNEFAQSLYLLKAALTNLRSGRLSRALERWANEDDLKPAAR